MKLKNIFTAFLVVLLTLSFAIPAAAAIQGDELPQAGEPLLITNAGQGPGGKMGRLLISRAQVVENYDYNAEPTPEDLTAKDYKSLFVVIGSSAKGLGASGITIAEEIARLDKMMAEAKDLGMQIFAIHIEGEARRGKEGSANEQSIDAIAPHADHIIVVKASNKDDRFTDIADNNDIPLTILDQPMDFISAVKEMYK